MPAPSPAYDYAIVGAGAAGCVLAYRLSQNPARRVLLIEAGGRDAHPLLHMPKGIAKVMADPNFIWAYMTAPEPAADGAQESWARGRVLGGSSAINGMMYVRGQDKDFEALAAIAGPDWSWPKIAAAYKAIERHELGAGDARGGDGPLRISLPRVRAPVSRLAIEAGRALGLAVKEDVNDPEDCARIGLAPLTVYNGKRQSAAVAFLRPIADRANLKIETGFAVDRVVFDGRRAVGVRGRRNGEDVEISAGEVLLSGGCMASPAILQRSGIGPADHLRTLGIDVLHDAPAVGANVREHRGMVMQWRVRDDASENRDFYGARLLANTARYYLTGDGPMAGGAYEAGAWVKTQADLDRPDGQILIAPFTFDYASPTFDVERRGGMNFCVYNLRPQSTGQIRIRSRDPTELPSITANYGADDADLATMVRLIRYARKLAATEPLAGIVCEETRPGPHYQSAEEIRAAHRKFGYGNYHACGSCRIGADDASAVDPRLCVRGVDGVRVVDTSIFPAMLAGNTNAPAMATAWRAADLILEDTR